MHLTLGLILGFAACARVREDPPAIHPVEQRLLTLDSLRRGAVASVITTLLAVHRTYKWRDSPGAALCLSFRTPDGRGVNEPDSSLLVALLPERVRTRSDCPPTLGTGYVVVTPGRNRQQRELPPPPPPQDHVDPQEIDFVEQRFFLPDSARFEIQMHQSTVTWYYSCSTAHATAEAWTSRCRTTGSGIF